eukprot:scaffold14763_cov77-Cyclotella_meneghiniana.AAC.3
MLVWNGSCDVSWSVVLHWGYSRQGVVIDTAKIRLMPWYARWRVYFESREPAEVAWRYGER